MTALAWHPIAMAFLTLAGIGLCGFGAICIAAGARIDRISACDRVIGNGISASFVGLLLLAAAFGVRAL